MSSAGNPALDVEAGIAEGLLRLGGAALEGGVDFGGFGDCAHAASTAAGDGLDEHAGALRKVSEESLRLLDGDGVGETGDDGNVVFLGEGAGLRLGAKEVEGLGAGTDEGEPCLLAGAGEGRALGEEAVAGVDGIAACLPRGGDELLDIEVGSDAPALERADGIGFAGVQVVGVVLGVHGNGTNAELASGPHDADGDLSTVGDEQTLDGHRHSSGTRFQRRSILHATAWALRRRVATYHHGWRRAMNTARHGGRRR